MSDQQNTPVDPHEKLVIVGNQLLQVIHEQQQDSECIAAMHDAAFSDPRRFMVLVDAHGGPDYLIAALNRIARRDSLIREYTTLRQTIESDEAARVTPRDI